MCVHATNLRMCVYDIMCTYVCVCVGVCGRVWHIHTHVHELILRGVRICITNRNKVSQGNPLSKDY